MEWVPGPAIDGSKSEPVTPVPVNVPPSGDSPLNEYKPSVIHTESIGSL